MSDWYNTPYDKINEIFDGCQKNGKSLVSELDIFLAEELPKCYHQLPWLNEVQLDHVYPNQLVRFRGMIQDMCDPEVYVETCVDKNTDGSETLKLGRYRDFISCSAPGDIIINSSKCKTNERKSYVCISIPGENDWAKKIYTNQNEGIKESVPVSTDTPSLKRRMDDAEICEDSQESNSMEVKKLRDTSRNESGHSHNLTNPVISKFPFPVKDGMACLAKVYDEKVDLRLNDIIEAVGILSRDPPLPPLDEEGTDPFSTEEDKDNNFPSSLVPRLQVVWIKKKLHCNPLLPTIIDDEKLVSCSLNIREVLGSVLDTAFLGDELASEYFLCHLVSSVNFRQDILPIGKFGLNLHGITAELQEKNYPQLLYELVQTLSTHSYLFHMTLENMNTMDFIPKKDYEQNCLRSGFLQLPPHLQLVVDETKLTAGKLDGKAVRNLTALGNLIRWQKVDYDFQFHNLEQHTNVPVFILSEGKAMITSDFRVPFRPQQTDVQQAFSQVNDLLTDHILEQVRTHLTLARIAPYNLPENMQKKIQDDFVSSREHEEGMTADDLHNVLTLARLLAQSCGKGELTNEIWRSARIMEDERRRRIKDDK